ncbi:FmdB family zinc ribbon protein [Mariniluteicoccus flavus]
MPTYQYRCKECASDLEVVQKFTDDALTTCPSCGAEALRKVYNAVGVHFKGSGFYRTDSKASSAPKTGSSESGAKKPDAKPSDSGAKKADAKPAAASSTGSGSTT